MRPPVQRETGDAELRHADSLALLMTEIAEMFSQALPAPSLEPRGAASAPAAGGKSTKPQSHIHTLLGADVRIEGNMTFTGGLRIEGVVVGDVSAVGDSNNTIMVSKSGKITGEIRSQHVILNGQVRGSVHCARSVEILEHGKVLGDIFDCKAIEIRAGGIVHGSLTRTSSPAFEAQRWAHLDSA